MERFIARQPIFDRQQNIYGYELLFRSSLDNYFDGSDLDNASSSVIANSFLLFSIEEMTDGTRAFLNTTHNTLKSGYIYALPQDSVVIDILQPLIPDPELVKTCRQLKRAGYTLALDDFTYQPEFESLLDCVDLVKIDLLNNSPEDAAEYAELLQDKGKKLQAIKVETHQVFELALKMGFDYFQGYFFSKPAVLSRKDIPANRLKYIQILKEVNAVELDFQRLSEVIQGEMSVSFKLLKLINSAAFGMPNPVRSIKQALGLLGSREIRKWASLISLTGMADEKPNELVIYSLARGKACELIAGHVGMLSRASDLFLMGLFSLLDAIVDRPLADILEEIPFEEDLKAALLGKEGRPKRVLDLVIAQEMGLWNILSAYAKSLNMPENALQEIHIEAVQWAHQTFRS